MWRSRRLSSDDDLGADGEAGDGMWLDDAEFIQLLQELMRVLQPRIANPPKPGRRRRILTKRLLARARAAAEASGADRLRRRARRSAGSGELAVIAYV
jgi:hypothetical protein